MESVHKLVHFGLGKVLRIQREIFILVANNCHFNKRTILKLKLIEMKLKTEANNSNLIHIVNIRPHCVQGYLLVTVVEILLIVLYHKNNLPDSVDIY